MDLEGAFRELESLFPGLRRRESQIQVAEAVDDSLDHPGSRLAVEAPTGTGKTIALLVPAIMRRGTVRTVVSTQGNLLATRLATEDVTRIKAALGWDEETVLLKGRRNYLCLERLHRNLPLTAVKELEIVAPHRDGDLTRMGLDAATARRINDDRRFCLGAACSYVESCYSRLAREAAKKAKLVATNHSLLIADVVARENLLGDYDALLLDEAHHLPSVAARALVSQVSPAQLSRVSTALHLTDSSRQQIEPAITDLGQLLNEVLGGAQRFMLSAPWPQLEDSVERLHNAPLPVAGAEERHRLAHGEWLHMLSALTNVNRSLTKAIMVAYVEREAGALSLVAQPLRVSGFLRRELYQSRTYDQETGAVAAESPRTVVATSATLRTVGEPDGFGYFLEQAGLTDARTLRVPSPFDSGHAGLYLPPATMRPAQDGSVDPAYVARTAPEIVWANELIGGGAFVLTTSWAWLHAYAGALKRLTQRPIYVQQEDGNNDALLEAFQQRPGILVGTRRYWEGIDIPGRALSLVVITKLPFPNSSNDPVLQSRMQRIRARKPGAEFQLVLLPEMLLTLRQGIGRLIRSETDYGVVMVLDDRARSSRYAAHVLDAIGYEVIRERQAAARFLARFIPVREPAPDAAPA